MGLIRKSQIPAAETGKDGPLLPDSFAECGFHAVRAGSYPLARYQVLGERSSGTNFIKRLIGRNTDLKHSDELGWKHGFCQMLAVPRDMAVICVVRHPERWALSMHAKPWHSTADLQRLPFEGFIRAEWSSVFDKQRYLGKLGRDYVGRPLQQDRDPLTGQPFSSLFALRRAKLTHLMSMPARDCTCVFLRLEEAQKDPKATLERIRTGLGLQFRPGGGYRPVNKPQGWRFRTAVGERPAPPAEMSAGDRDFMWSELNAEQEARLGYTP